MFGAFIRELKQTNKDDAEALSTTAMEAEEAAAAAPPPPPPSVEELGGVRLSIGPPPRMAKPWERGAPCTDLADQQRRGARCAAPPPRKARLVVDERASAAVERPIISKRATEVAVEDERRRKSLPSQADGHHLGAILAGQRAASSCMCLDTRPPRFLEPEMCPSRSRLRWH